MSNDKSATRIGVLVPAGNVVHEREFTRLRPPGVEFRFAGFGYPPAAATDFCADMADNMRAPMQELVDWGAELILVGCTTASMMCSGEQRRAQLEQMAGVPVVTAAAASSLACRALGADSLAVATPYGDNNNRIVADFLRSQGIRVAALEGLNLDRSVEVWKQAAPTLTPQRVFEFSQSVDRPDAGALYLPCTGMGSLEAIDMFEHATGKSAFSSVQAGFWASLRRLGINGRQAGSGRLLEQWEF
jgi:maleate cis-trans isomerase